MKKNDIGQTVTLLANLGVIAGILFLAMEIRQNNAFLEMEARAIRDETLLDGWAQIVTDPGLVDIMIKDRNEEALTPAEEMRLNAYWMGYFIRRQWRFENFPDEELDTGQLHRLYQAYGSMRRAWRGGGDGSVAAGKDNFPPEFVRFIEQRLEAGT